jgi:hypothetical protein
MSELSPHTEVILSSDLFDDDPCLENMSALASAVLDAYMSGYGWLDGPTKKDCRGVAAALRAAADQVVPDDKPSSFSPGAPQAFAIQRRTTRRQLLTIAAELETFAQ